MTNPPDFQVTSGGAIALQQPISIARKSPSRLFWERLRQDKAALAGGVVIVLLVLIAVFGGPIAKQVTGHGPNQTFDSMTDAYGVPYGPNGSFWFGADSAGRDLFVRTMYGARTSLFVGVVASGLALLIGLIVGMVAGFFGGSPSRRSSSPSAWSRRARRRNPAATSSSSTSSRACRS